MEVSSISVASTKMIDKLILELLLADDCAPLAHTQEALEAVVDHFSKATWSCGQIISLKETEVLHQNSLHVVYSPTKITISSHPFNSVKESDLTSLIS